VADVAYLLNVGSRPVSADLLRATKEVEVDASLEAASSFRLRIAISETDDADWSVLREDVFKPLTAVQIRIQAGTVPQALINGYVANASVTWSDDGPGSTLEVSGMDATLLMNLEEKVKDWGSQSDGQIAQQILGDHKLTAQVTATSAPVIADPEGRTIQRGTDMRFLRRLAQRNGYECFVQPEPASGADFGYFRPPQLTGAPVAVLTVRSSRANVSGFTVRYDMTRPTSASAASLDARTKQQQSATASTASLQALGSSAALGRLSPTPVVQATDTGLVQTNDLRALAQAVVDRSSWAVVAEGDVAATVGILRPGGIVNVRGAGSLYDGSYYLTRVLHRISRGGYAQRFEARRNALHTTGSETYAQP
jgi:phage protein D